LADFYLDHNVSRGMAVRLRRAGHTAHTADETGKAHASDDEHFLIAQLQGWILITHNWRDFKLLHDAWRRWVGAHWPRTGIASPVHGGIVVIPQPDVQRRHWLPEHAAHEVALLLASRVTLTDALYRWRPSVGWEKHLAPLP
jgi:hypothetical protein